MGAGGQRGVGRSVTARRLLLQAVATVLAAGTALAATARAVAPSPDAVPSPVVARATQGGTLWLRPNPDLLRTLGVGAVGWSASAESAFLLRPATPVEVELGDGAPTRLLGGALRVPGLLLGRGDGATSPALWLVPDGNGPLDWRLVDARGDTWLRIGHGMRSPDRQRDGLRLVTADLRVGPALAAWTRPDAEGRLFANAALQLPLSPLVARDEKAVAKSCLVPNWPGVAGFVADVELIDMDDKYSASHGVDVLRCRALPGGGACDGPGGAEGEVVIVPSAVLRNRNAPDAADIPWRTKFSGSHAPYGNDQHPYLVWALYRFDADGRIEQIARSGVKHAFATANENCHPDARCPFNGQILGRACEDTYNAGSNDQSFFLSPHSEFIPARAIWGRCGSVFDDLDNDPQDGLDGCDGLQDAPPNDLYRERLRARESDIDAGSNPGAQYRIDAWYIVRDDVDIFNSMGSRSLAPAFAGGLWNLGPLGAFRQGPVIDRWLEQSRPGEAARRGDADTPEGHLSVASRVMRLPDGRYRYDYAAMNFDFARAVTEPATAEPNLRVLRNLGIDAVEIGLLHGASVDSSEFRDGDGLPGNDWGLSAQAGSVTWSAPGGATLDWGQLRFLRLVSGAAPGRGEARLRVAEPGSPGHYRVEILVPDGSVVFRDSYE